MRVLASTVTIFAMIALGCRDAQNAERGSGEPVSSPEASARKLPSIVATDAELIADVENLAERLVREDQFSGVVLVLRGGHPLFRRAFGLADRDARRANTVDTAFELTSVSKMFTAVVVAQLAEQNKVRFDATIGSLLPDYPAGQARSQVTVHHLLTMSSGIPDVFGHRNSGQGSAVSGRCQTSGSSSRPHRSNSRREHSGRTAIRIFWFWAQSSSGPSAVHSLRPSSSGVPTRWHDTHQLSVKRDG